MWAYVQMWVSARFIVCGEPQGFSCGSLEYLEIPVIYCHSEQELPSIWVLDFLLPTRCAMIPMSNTHAMDNAIEEEMGEEFQN